MNINHQEVIESIKNKIQNQEFSLGLDLAQLTPTCNQCNLEVNFYLNDEIKFSAEYNAQFSIFDDMVISSIHPLNDYILEKDGSNISNELHNQIEIAISENLTDKMVSNHLKAFDDDILEILNV